MDDLSENADRVADSFGACELVLTGRIDPNPFVAKLALA